MPVIDASPLASGNDLSLLETIGLIASIAALILAVVAIWLSYIFYRLTSTASDQIRSTATNIDVQVQRLGTLVEVITKNTLDELHETNVDIRRYALGGDRTPAEDEEQKRVNLRLQDLATSTDKKVDEILSRFGDLPQETRESAREQLQDLVRETVEQSDESRLQAREETIRDSIREIMRKKQTAGVQPTAADAVQGLRGVYGVREVLRELEQLRESGALSWDGDLSPATPIRLNEPQQQERN